MFVRFAKIQAAVEITETNNRIVRGYGLLERSLLSSCGHMVYNLKTSICLILYRERTSRRSAINGNREQFSLVPLGLLMPLSGFVTGLKPRARNLLSLRDVRPFC